MSYRPCLLGVAVAAFSLVVVASILAQNPPAPAPNSDATYQQLRSIRLSGEAVTVTNFELKRDAATFLLRSGTVCFVTPVQGRVTGAVFVGDGSMGLKPPSHNEVLSLMRLTKGQEFDEIFTHLALRFTDATYEQIKKGGTPAAGGCDAGLLEDSQHATRKKLNYNLSARILQDLLNGKQGSLFVAFVHGKHYDDKLLYFMDPNGAPGVSPEQVELMSYGESKFGTWASFDLSSESRHNLGAGAEPNSRIHVEHQNLDATIEKNAHLTGKASTTFISQAAGLRVVGLNLHPTLRVDSVKAQDGEPLSFIQEDKNDDPDLYVILPKTLARGDKYTIITTYNGKDAVTNEGGGNYYPVARQDWYPNKGGGLGDYSDFDMTFRIPKGMKMAATGSLVSESTDGGQSVTVWKSDAAQPMAGFQFGRMKEQDAKLTSPDYLIAAYANEEAPNWAEGLKGGTMGNLSTTSMMKQPLSEAQFAVGLYSTYFGILPFKRLNLTQQTACGYGQSWPGLVWLPICSFYDGTVRHQLGLDFGDSIYWKVVTPHEVAHQWWGQTVGFESYRDQWMSEGFADFSASLFLQSAYGKDGQKEFINFWNEERRSLVERNADGFRAIDVGPVTMGYRSSNSKTGNIGAHLIYPKGAYILHMVRMMMWDRKDGDLNFRGLMQDFVKTYSGRAATTEDFKAMVEKHMNPQMKTFGSGSMDWFFNEYVYGTALPAYKIDVANFDTDASGNVVLSFKLTQSGVDDNFHMLVPIYLELADGRITFLGRAQMNGNASIEAKIPLAGIKDKPRRAVVNYYDDVLASSN